MIHPSRTSDSASNRHNRTRVLVITDDVTEISDLVEALRLQSLDVQLLGYDGASEIDFPSESPAAALCFLTDFVEHSADLVTRIRANYAPRYIPVIGRLSRMSDYDEAYDSVLYAPVHPAQLSQRIAAMIRLGRMEVEISRRALTLKESFGQDFALNDRDVREPFRILFVGKADPSYMVIVNALKDKNVDVVAAFTSFTAFDYLHDRTFDAVIMNALNCHEPAMTISESMRRNSRLYHVPTLFLVDDLKFDGRDRAYSSGASDLIDVNSPLSEISGRVLELANYHRLHEQLKHEFKGLGGATCTDPETGMFNGEFLAAHLRRVSRDCRARQQPLTILTMKLHPDTRDAVTADDLRRAYSKAVSLISGLVRMQDIVARVDIDTVIIAFPEEVRSAVETVLDRMTGLIECAAFEREGGGPSSLTLRIEAAIIEQEIHESAEMLIGNGLRSVDRDAIEISRRA
jgi:two-component system cell cycle response regulator PopA